MTTDRTQLTDPDAELERAAMRDLAVRCLGGFPGLGVRLAGSHVDLDTPGVVFEIREGDPR